MNLGSNFLNNSIKITTWNNLINDISGKINNYNLVVNIIYFLKQCPTEKVKSWCSNKRYAWCKTSSSCLLKKIASTDNRDRIVKIKALILIKLIAEIDRFEVLLFASVKLPIKIKHWKKQNNKKICIIGKRVENKFKVDYLPS